MQIKKNSFTKITMDITQKVTEQEDRFIFETISSWLSNTYRIDISKKILCRALECFKEEHCEEYARLMREIEDADSN